MNNRTEKRKWHIWEEDEFKQTVKQINSNITILNFTRIRKNVKNATRFHIRNLNIY